MVRYSVLISAGGSNGDVGSRDARPWTSADDDSAVARALEAAARIASSAGTLAARTSAMRAWSSSSSAYRTPTTRRYSALKAASSALRVESRSSCSTRVAFSAASSPRLSSSSRSSGLCSRAGSRVPVMRSLVWVPGRGRTARPVSVSPLARRSSPGPAGPSRRSPRRWRQAARSAGTVVTRRPMGSSQPDRPGVVVLYPRVGESCVDGASRRNDSHKVGYRFALRKRAKNPDRRDRALPRSSRARPRGRAAAGGPGRRSAEQRPGGPAPEGAHRRAPVERSGRGGTVRPQDPR